MLRRVDQQVEIDLARGRQHDVLRAIAAGEVLPHLFHRQRADAFDRAQHAFSQRMAGEMGGPAFVVGPERRLVFVHLDLFEDHLLFGREILLPQGGPQNIAQELDGPRLELGQHRGVVDGAFFAGEGVVVGAHFVELAVHVVGRAAGGAFEHHVFEKMAHARHIVRLIAGAGLHEKSDGRGVRLVVAFGDDFQAVGELDLEKLHGRRLWGGKLATRVSPPQLSTAPIPA